jgi:hypothetical protein
MLAGASIICSSTSILLALFLILHFDSFFFFGKIFVSLEVYTYP